MNAAHGSIHRRAVAEAGFHSHENEFVVVLKTTHRALGSTSHHVTPLSISAAIDLHQQLGDVLTDVMWDGVDRSEIPF